MPEVIEDEPILTAAVLAPIVVWVALTLGLKMDQGTATAIATVILVVGGWFARCQATTVAKAEAKIEEAFAAGRTGEAKPTL